MGHLIWEEYMILNALKVFNSLIVDLYKAEDVNNCTGKLWIVITDSAWLLFVGEKESAMSKAWATLYTLHSLKRNLEAPCNLHFQWTKPDRIGRFDQEFYIEEAKDCIEKITTNLKKLGVDIQYNNTEEAKSSSIDIENVLLEIEVAEKRLSENAPLEELQELLTLYQKVSVRLNARL
jgi:hypothetical protein